MARGPIRRHRSSSITRAEHETPATRSNWTPEDALQAAMASAAFTCSEILRGREGGSAFFAPAALPRLSAAAPHPALLPRLTAAARRTPRCRASAAQPPSVAA
jgi:hypothetical protein